MQAIKYVRTYVRNRKGKERDRGLRERGDERPAQRFHNWRKGSYKVYSGLSLAGSGLFVSFLVCPLPAWSHMISPKDRPKVWISSDSPLIK